MISNSRFVRITVSLLLTIARPVIADERLDAMQFPAAALRNERVLAVPGDPERPVMLQVTVFMPDGPGPFPLAVINHGSSLVPPDEQTRYRSTFSVFYFLSRGYAVALPMMRGYAGSEGHLRSHGCDAAADGLEAAQDIRAVIDYMKQQPKIDGTRIVVAGQSFGGWNALATGTLDVPGVKGLVSFAGGIKPSHCVSPDSAMSVGAATFGGATKVPSIWFFGDNDAVFSTWAWHSLYNHYVAGGAPAELVAYGPFGDDSHNMLGSGEALPIWTPKVDAFLARIGLPNSLVNPEYLPGQPPAPSHYAVIDDVQALPYLTEQQYTYYRSFLQRPFPSAFAIGMTSAAAASEGFDPAARALKSCEQKSAGCRLYAIDHDVVWTRPTPSPPPSNYAPLADEHAVPYVNDEGRNGYVKFLTMRRPKAFAIASDGGWSAASQGLDPAAFVINACQKNHADCALYAVDADVVWKK